MAYPKVKTEQYTNLGGINTKVSSYIQGPEEFKQIVNMNFVVAGSLSKRPGTTLSFGATVQGKITGLYEFERLNGASYVVATANTNVYTVTQSGFNPFITGLASGYLFDFQTFVDRLFLCNGQIFKKFDGLTAYPFSLPLPNAGLFGGTVAAGGSLTPGTTAIYLISYGFVNDRGYYGPPVQNGVTIIMPGTSDNAITYSSMFVPPGFGISQIILYRSGPNGVDMFGTTFAPITGATAIDTGFPLNTSIPFNNNLFFTMSPKYLEIYNNQLVMAGFSSVPSTIYWSEIGEPEAIDPTFFAEFRTNDGDVIRGIKAYESSLIVAKERSFHRLVGDNPSNFLTQQVSDQYGCLSNRSMVTFEDLIWFLDQKGIVEYNGANVQIVSNKVEPIFNSMNVVAARENATSIHFRQQNEVWFAIPCDGATLNNCIVVYDYLAKAWTTYNGLNTGVLSIMGAYLNNKTPFYGGYSGSIFHFDKNFTADNKSGITCLVQHRYVCPMGQSTEEQYRRLFLNINEIFGSSQAITVNFRTNYGESVVLTRYMYQQPFQSRIDFGLPARSLSSEFVHYSATLPFRIDGFTIESRFQRDV